MRLMVSIREMDVKERSLCGSADHARMFLSFASWVGSSRLLYVASRKVLIYSEAPFVEAVKATQSFNW